MSHRNTMVEAFNPASTVLFFVYSLFDCGTGTYPVSLNLGGHGDRNSDYVPLSNRHLLLEEPVLADDANRSHLSSVLETARRYNNETINNSKIAIPGRRLFKGVTFSLQATAPSAATTKICPSFIDTRPVDTMDSFSGVWDDVSARSLTNSPINNVRSPIKLLPVNVRSLNLGFRLNCQYL